MNDVVPSCEPDAAVTRAVTSMPAMVVSAAWASARPPTQIAPGSWQPRAGMRTVTAPAPDGVTVSSHVPACPGASRALVIVPPVTSIAAAASRLGERPSGAPPNATLSVNGVSPSWLAGTLSNRACGAGLLLPETTVPLCVSVASRSVAALRMVPPLSARLSGVTATSLCAPSPDASV